MVTQQRMYRNIDILFSYKYIYARIEINFLCKGRDLKGTVGSLKRFP